VVTRITRLFTQVGTGRPGQDSPLCRDADAIALALLGRNAAAAAPGLSSQAAPGRRRTGRRE
jgi:hypothetical protein